MYLVVVGDVATLVVIGVEDEVSLVLRYAVAVQRVAGGHHLPRQPAGAEGLVAGEEERKVSRIVAAAPLVLRH